MITGFILAVFVAVLTFSIMINSINDIDDDE